MGHARAQASADPLAPRTAVAVSLRGAPPPTIDGRLDEPVWRTAPIVGDLVQTRPRPGAPATFRTEARVAFDETALYVAVRSFDPHPDSIVAPYPRRDDEATSDWVFVEIDSRRDRRTAFSFGVNPRGVQVDGMFVNDGVYDPAWNAVWSAAARIDSLGWTAEYRIPFTQLAIGRTEHAVGGAPDVAMGFNVYRAVTRLGESANWSPRLPTHVGVVSHFNLLRGVAPPPRTLDLEVTPYVAARAARSPAASGDLAGALLPRGASALAGLDARAHLTPSLALTATLRPDFGQVEADPSVVNLTTFETFFPEQRPFFVEGADVFTFNAGAGLGLPFHARDRVFDAESPFYSRRIGRAPRVDVPSGARVLDAPSATDVLGAAKLTGHTAGGWSVGALGAVTARESAHVVDAAGLPRAIEAAPRTELVVARAARDFRDGASAAGVLVSAVRRSALDAPLGDALAHDALLLGGDVRHRVAGGAVELSGFAAASRVAGRAAAIRTIEQAADHDLLRPDAPHLRPWRDDSSRTVLDGVAAQARIAKPGGHWRWSLVGHAISPGFETNDVGFQRQADWLLAVGALRYEQFTPGRHLRRWTLGVDQVGGGWSFGGERRAAVATVGAGATLRNEWDGTLSLGRERATLSTEALRGGPALLVPPRTTWSATLTSDTRRRTQLTVAADGFVERSPASRGGTVTAGLASRLSDRLFASVGPSIADVSDAWQYVGVSAAPGGAPSRTSWTVARLHQRTASLVARGDVAFSSHLTVQLYAQPLVASAAYDEAGVVVAPRATRAVDRVRATSLAAEGLADPSFGSRDALANAVLRWEYRPGSALFVVWSGRRQATVDDGRWRVGPALRGVFEAPAANVLLVKWTYRLAR